MHKELVVSLAELRYVSIICPNCKTAVTLDMAEPPAFGVVHGFFAPKACPGCQQIYDAAIPPGVDSLQLCYKQLSRVADRISFRGTPEVLSSAEELERWVRAVEQRARAQAWPK